MEERNKVENHQEQPVVKKKKKGKKILAGIIGIIVLIIVINALSSSQKDTTDPASTDAVKVEGETVTDTTNDTQEEEGTAATMGEKNALNKAGDYLAYTAFSHPGLISQLEYEGFTAEEATYAADNCGADWNEQAAKKAKEYTNVSSFSRSGLIDQLKYEGFTAEQAEYGVTAIGY